MRLKDIAVGVSDVLKIDPRQLVVEPGFNVRMEGPELDEHIASLKGLIRASGVQRPLVVRLKDDRAVVVDGHCRLRAVMELIDEGVDIQSVPCLPEGRSVSESERTALLITANSGKPLSALEKGEVFKRLVGYGWSLSQISQKVGIGEKQINNLLELTSADDSVKGMIAAGEVSATTALKTIQAEGNEQAAETLKKAVETAKAEGRTKATAKTIKKATKVAEPEPAEPSTIEDEHDPILGSSNSADLPQEEGQKEVWVEQRPRITCTAAKWKEAIDVLFHAVECDDIKIIHAIIRDFLGLKESRN